MRERVSENWRPHHNAEVRRAVGSSSREEIWRKKGTSGDLARGCISSPNAKPPGYVVLLFWTGAGCLLKFAQLQICLLAFTSSAQMLICLFIIPCKFLKNPPLPSRLQNSMFKTASLFDYFVLAGSNYFCQFWGWKYRLNLKLSLFTSVHCTLQWDGFQWILIFFSMSVIMGWT